MMPSVTAGPRPTCTVRKSATVSPTVVERILTSQNVAVTAGTLFSRARVAGVVAKDPRREAVVMAPGHSSPLRPELGASGP